MTYKAWVIIDAGNTKPSPALIDDRLPVFWMKVTATKCLRERLNGQGRVAKVIITEVE
jgi:hypothetical protein